jgi:hypothetical protein
MAQGQEREQGLRIHSGIWIPDELLPNRGGVRAEHS